MTLDEGVGMNAVPSLIEQKPRRELLKFVNAGVVVDGRVHRGRVIPIEGITLHKGT